jgi:hypothetical protein
MRIGAHQEAIRFLSGLGDGQDYSEKIAWHEQQIEEHRVANRQRDRRPRTGSNPARIQAAERRVAKKESWIDYCWTHRESNRPYFNEQIRKAAFDLRVLRRQLQDLRG